jgi:hypothetical protein
VPKKKRRIGLESARRPLFISLVSIQQPSDRSTVSITRDADRSMREDVERLHEVAIFVRTTLVLPK